MKKQTGKSVLLTFLLLCMVLFSSVNGLQLTSAAVTYTTGSYTVTANGGLNLRAAANTSSTKLILIPQGTVVSVTKIDGAWGNTTYSGKTGWISLEYTKKNEPVPSGSLDTKISKEKEKFPSGKYWNHTPGTPNNEDAYTATPCNHHGSCSGYKGTCGCNSFNGQAIQCHGFATKLGFDIFGLNPYSGWTKIYSDADIRVGDIVRYRNNTHSIFITGISGNIYTYADGNSDGKCKIRWDATVTRADLTDTFTYVWRANNYDAIVPPSPTKPVKAAITVSAPDYFKEDAVQFTFSSDKASSYTIVIDKKDAGTVLTQSTTNTKFSYKLPTGFYSAYVKASNSEGTLDSAPVSFTVCETRKDNIGTDVYALISSVSDGKILTNSGQVAWTGESKDASQVMRLQRQSDGTYAITSMADGNGLGALEAGYKNGTEVAFVPKSTAAEQLWRIEKQNDQYSLSVQCAPSVILAVPNEGGLQLWERTNAPSQRFSIRQVYPVSSITPSQTSVQVGVGKTIDINGFLTIAPANAYNPTLVYSTSDAAVATVSAKGVVSGKKDGAVKITAKSVDGRGKSASITVNVGKQQSTYVTLRIGYTKAIQNGVKASVDNVGTKPFKISGKTMLPFRFIGEKLGGKVQYVNDKTPIKLSYGDSTVELTLGSKTMKVTTGTSSKTVALDVAAQKKNGKTYIPLRAIGAALGFEVYYQSGTELIVISSIKMTDAVRTQRLDEGKAYIR